MENLFNFPEKLFTEEETMKVPQTQKRYYCPFCRQEILNGDDIIGISKSELAHWDCYFNRYNGLEYKDLIEFKIAEKREDM